MSQGLSRKQKRMLTQIKNDARAVLDHEPSVRFLCRIMEECGYFDDQMTGNSSTFYKLGQRKTGMQILAQLQVADEDALLKMLQVAAEERRRNSGRNEENNDED